MVAAALASALGLVVQRLLSPLAHQLEARLVALVGRVQPRKVQHAELGRQASHIVCQHKNAQIIS
jgi:hypothetical protein